MPSNLDAGPAPHAPHWLAPADELPLFEGLRLGDAGAFATLAEAVHPLLGGLLTCYAHVDADRRAVLERSWACALSSLDMFRWQTSFSTWVAGIAVEHGRAHALRRPFGLPAAEPSAPPAKPPRPGPSGWDDLPWGARWDGSAAAVSVAFSGMALPEREVLHVRRVEGWSARRACDVLGLTEAGEERLLDVAERAILDALALIVGDVGSNPSPARRAALRRMLCSPSPIDPVLAPTPTAVFRAWRASQRRGWRRLLPPRPR